MLRLFVLLLVAAGAASAEERELPQYAPDTHLGVQTCSGSPCHGRTTPGKGNVLQNEHLTWSRYDAHSKAYTVLHEERSRRIASKLGIGNPHEAALCLDCHADNVPENLRGERFALEDGVGCEACHGGSQHWAKTHHTGQSHKTSVEQGAYPTDDPEARAALCLSCHFGNDRKFVRHTLYGAGHPRLRFELHVYSQTQPAHYDMDDDYAERNKDFSYGVKAWAIGQAVAVQAVLDALLDPKRGRDGIWPEFSLFDCNACHHPVSDLRWRPRRTTGLGPGKARLADANFLMLRHALAAADPPAAEALGRSLRSLHAALSSGSGNPQRAAGRVRELLADSVARIQAWEVDAATARGIAKGVLREAISGEYSDYAGAEQAAMAVQVLVDSLYQLGEVDDATLAAINVETSQILEAVKDPDRFRPGSAVPAFRRLQDRLF
jgi:hypothetical protein